ncbi:MAG: class I SAM-dependent methyltransferase [Candidatus Rokubacteria bacterium]|nr:class I SAM-dependent methyltransferase [Candidatus Rokubacteria bacterium]
MKPQYLAVHLEEDRRHWYFRGRLAVLLATLQAWLPPPPLRILELGCGSGNVLGALRSFGDVVGLEADPQLRAAGRAEGLDVRAGALPNDTGVPPGWADVVLLLDVIEHLDDDAAAITAARSALRPGGTLVVTVPAHPWLWSAHDLHLGHRRRYTAGALRRVVEGGGFGVRHLSHFNTVLFPAVALVRLAKRFRGDERHDLHTPRPAVNRLLERVFAFERHVVPRYALPFGVSLLAIARSGGGATR